MWLRVLIFILCVSATTTHAWAFDYIIVTPKTQKKLGLDFEFTAYKHQRTWIVDFVIPTESKLQAITSIGVISPGDFSSPDGLSVPFAGLTRFPRDNPSKPKEVQWVRGARFWVGDSILAETQMQFDFRGETYSIHLRDTPLPEPDHTLQPTTGRSGRTSFFRLAPAPAAAELGGVGHPATLLMRQTFLIFLAAICVLTPGHAAEPVVGSYTKVSVSDENVIAAANFAVQARSHAAPATDSHQPKALKLLKVLRAEQQVVAGTNYKLKLSVVRGDKTKKTVEAVVWWQSWRKPNPYELISWK